MSEFQLNEEDVKSIILNAHKIKKFNKCPDCDGTGFLNWNGETGGEVKSGRLTEYDSIRLDSECEECDGVGYVNFLMY